MAFVPLALVKSLAQSLIASEGEWVVYRRPAASFDPTTGVATTTFTDYTVKAVLSTRKAQYANGTLVREAGEELMISAADLAIEPQPGDVVVFGTDASVSANSRKVEQRRVTRDQGIDIYYDVELER